MSEPDLASAWVLTRALSPRGHVRAAAQLASGETLNDYDHQWSVNELPPTTTWAMYLSGDRRRYDFLCFDLDSSRGNAPYDAGRLSLWLDELNIAHLICESGPTGGRHVWLGLSGAVDAGDVKNLALLAKSLLPSLDPTPLSNPITGCVRPPGAPHRLGGVSVAQGPLSALTSLPVQLEQLEALRDFLVDVGAEIPAPDTAPLRGMTVDDDGHPYIAGPKRPLSPRLTMMLDAPPAEDASYTLATVLAGCAHARWRHADVLALVDDSPALEHVRTLRGRGGTDRIPRTAQGRIRALHSAWASAVRYVAAHPLHGTGDDTDYLARSNTAVAAVQRAQERADAMPGLWGADRASSAGRRGSGTHSTRAVLDALCLYVAQSAQLVVEADVRRLSADTGYGRSTVHTALQALARPLVDGDPESAWIVRVGDPPAPHGQRYRLSERFSTETEDGNRTQVLARPAPQPPTRSYWLSHLSQALLPLSHDTFAAPHSLGRTAGLVFKQLTPGAFTPVDELARRTGLDAGRTRGALHRLHLHGLVDQGAAGWARRPVEVLDRIAETLDVAGYLEQRRERYRAERAVWGWWQAEYAWMTKANKKRRHRRGATGVALFAQNDRPDYAQYPRGPDRRGDHREARRLVAAGALSPSTLARAA